MIPNGADHQDPETRELLALPIRPSAPYPFWEYTDLLILAFMAIPCWVAGELLGRLVLHLLPWTPPDGAKLLPGQSITYCLWFGTLYLILKLRYHAQFWRSLAWVAPKRGVWLSMVSGPVVAVWIWIMSLLLRTPQISDPFRQFTSDRVSLALLGIYVVVLGPISEELAFRGLMLPLVTRDLGTIFGIMATALPFALLHGPQYQWQWQHVLLIWLTGTAFGATRQITGSTAASTVMHATYNLTIYSAYVGQVLQSRL